MKFYKENGINPLGGCLPLLAQLPVFWSLFNVLKAIADWTPGHTPSYGMTVPFVESAHAARIFGISLYDQFLHPAVGESSTSRYLIVVFVLVSAATTFLTMRQSQKRGMLNQTPPDPDQPGAAAAQAMSKNMMYIAPFFALTGLYWQFGLVLYWVTTNVWTLGQQHFLFRSLPVVGSATVGASATQAASGSGAARNASGAKTGTAAKTGSASGKTAGAAAKTGAAKSGTAAKTGTKPANSTKPASKSGTSSTSGTSTTSGTSGTTAAAKAPAAKANANGAAANGAAANGSGLLKRFGKKEEPQDVPVAPPSKVVRQQPVRQTRSRRGNTGKR
jgi:YidC/Oxa1 family membrane protein insertase